MEREREREKEGPVPYRLEGWYHASGVTGGAHGAEMRVARAEQRQQAQIHQMPASINWGV